MFTVEAGLLGVVGGTAGFVLAPTGLVIAAAVSRGGTNPQSPFNSFAGLLPRGLLPATVIIVLITGIGVLAGALPARRAARMNPVDPLR